jgi:hypothetical protein
MGLQNTQLVEKFLFFGDGNNDSYMFPLSRLRSVIHDSDTTIEIYFENTVDPVSDSSDKVTLTIASGSEKTVMQAIADACADAFSNSMIVIADNVNQVYLNSNITDVALTLGSA